MSVAKNGKPKNMIDISRIRTEQRIFTDAWNLLKTHYDARTAQEWETLFDDVYIVIKRYEDTAQAGLARALAFAVIDEIDHRQQDTQGSQEPRREPGGEPRPNRGAGPQAAFFRAL